MQTLYLDIFSGISGDMFLGAVLDLGVDARALEQELKKLRLDGWQIRVARGQKANIAGVKFEVPLAQQHSHEHTHVDGTKHSHPHSHPQEQGHDQEHREEPGHAHGPHGGPLVETENGTVELTVFETNVPPRFRLYFYDADGKSAASPAPNAVTLQTIRPDNQRQSFKFKRRDDFLEATEELAEPHDFTAILKIKRGTRTELHETQFVEARDRGNAIDLGVAWIH